MDSWTLQGDSYSFLRGAPRNFSLCHRDGTPNHIEIFDIINVPSQRTAISETTCLCDIFGDDGESQSLSSSPSVGVFVHSQREVDGTAAATSPPADDLNDSSGSYHTAPGSIEGEEGFEDSGERVNSPTLQGKSSDRRLSEGEGQGSGHPEVSEDGCPNLESKSKPAPQQNIACPSPQVFSSGQTTPSPGFNTPYTLSPEGRLSSLSSSSIEKRLSPSSPYSKHSDSPEPRVNTPLLKDRHSSLSYKSVSPSPSLEPGSHTTSVCSESSNTQPLLQELSEQRTTSENQNSTSSPTFNSENIFCNFTESAADSRATHSSPLPSNSGSEFLSHSRETLPSPELRNTPHLPDIQASSPFPNLQGRVSLPDLLSRGSTPDLEDCTHNTELLANTYSGAENYSASPDSHRTKSSVEPSSTVSTPAPRFTPPSPVISIKTSPVFVENTVSPELRSAGPSTPSSPFRLSAASPTKSGTRTPSTNISSNSTFFEVRSQGSSPAINFSLSPSPGVRESCSPTEHRYLSPSPEIKIIASSPEVSRKEQFSEIEKSSFPLPVPRSDSATLRSPTFSPLITGISYSVVQPEDRVSPPFPELSQLFTPEPPKSPVSSEARNLSASRNSARSSVPESRGTQRDSCHTPGSLAQSEKTNSQNQTPSPQLNYHTPSPEPRNLFFSPDNHTSPLLHHKSRDLSPVDPLCGHTYQPLTENLSSEYNSCYTPPTSSLRKTPEAERESSLSDNRKFQSPTHLIEDSVSPLCDLDRRPQETDSEVQHISPVVVLHSSASISPVFTEEKINTSQKQPGVQGEEPPEEVYIEDRSSISALAKEKKDLSPHLFQSETPYNHPTPEIKVPSSNFALWKDNSPVRRAKSNSPVRGRGYPTPQFNSKSLESEGKILLQPDCIPQNSQGHLLPKGRRENTSSFTEDMSRHVSRRRTPSPPLTRFTPVHIIAPEKPYRQWQNRGHSPSQVTSSSPSGNLKKSLTKRESPDVAGPVDNNSHAHWVRQGRQLEREMQLEYDREISGEKQWDRGMKKEKKREERFPEKGEGWQGDASYRGEQVELSFSARNRKGPVSRTAAPTSRENRQGLPAVHSYPESLLAAKQLQQQQNLLRLASQQDTRGGVASRRPLPSAPHNKNNTPGRPATHRPCQSSSSSMGSELDETDNEVKWFTDVAFRSLSSPEVDYLDMYNSSHRSSTNISQPSTQESPAGVNAAWLAYADFRGSAPRLDQDEPHIQPPPVYYSDGLDPSRRYELGSFECVDVAVERDESRKIRRGVPKRQIQLKRKNNAEGKQDESSENSSPGLPVMMESPSQESHSRGTFVRQHSTPAAMQECHPAEHSPDSTQPIDRRTRLQKSASVEETCAKTKMATCLIKSVLSKKMQSVDKQSDQAGEEVDHPFEEKNPTTESIVVYPTDDVLLQ